MTRKYQKLNVCPFSGLICHNKIKSIPVTMAPTKMYGRRRPQPVRVLSEMYPMIGSVSASKKRGIPPNKPARNGSMPNPVTRKNMNIASAAGNRLLVRLPEP